MAPNKSQTDPKIQPEPSLRKNKTVAPERCPTLKWVRLFGLGAFVVLKWIQDWQFGLKLKSSLLPFEDLSGSKPQHILFKAEKYFSPKTELLGVSYFVLKPQLDPSGVHLGTMNSGINLVRLVSIWDPFEAQSGPIWAQRPTK